ncbi:MAG: hypothetical protein ACRDTN_10165, partial [Mycobacterium sp.]
PVAHLAAQFDIRQAPLFPANGWYPHLIASSLCIVAGAGHADPPFRRAFAYRPRSLPCLRGRQQAGIRRLPPKVQTT